ncbi:hypothetical protein [Halorhabdus rudnickae]|uniref:hypothetical protein n=1 Tax=Halorhabdus rudnickae TaxID=1775544 RepID=UPI00108313C9|nr:hypothetical protein [Halorhabdus rudnickae]
MIDGPVALDGATLLVGPSQAGKTCLTARALATWIDRHGTDGVVVLEFAPEVERDGRLLGGRLDRFRSIPDGVWHGVLEAHAPRAAAESQDEAVDLARDNAERAREVLDSAPEPTAVFANDATIPFQHAAGDPDRLTRYCDRADCAVLNAFASDELGTENPVTRREQAILDRLQGWADRSIRLSGES